MGNRAYGSYGVGYRVSQCAHWSGAGSSLGHLRHRCLLGSWHDLVYSARLINVGFMANVNDTAHSVLLTRFLAQKLGGTDSHVPSLPSILRNIGRRSSCVLSLEGIAYRRFGQVGSERSIKDYIDDSDSIIIDFVEEISLNWTINEELHDHSPKTEHAKIG